MNHGRALAEDKEPKFNDRFTMDGHHRGRVCRRRPMTQTLSPRKAAILANSEQLAPRRQQYKQRAAFYHEEELRYLRFLIPPGQRVLELGCGTGDVLAGAQPSFGFGVDISPAMIDQAKRSPSRSPIQGRRGS